MKKVILSLFIAGVLLISVGAVFAHNPPGYKDYSKKVCDGDWDKSCKNSYKDWKKKTSQWSHWDDDDDDSEEDYYCEDYGCGEDKVYVCHKPNTSAEKTLCISENAAKAHLDQGGYCGECVVVEEPEENETEPPEENETEVPEDWEPYCKPEGVGSGFDGMTFNGTVGEWCLSFFDPNFCNAFYGNWANDKLIMTWTEEWDTGYNEGWSDPNGYPNAYVDAWWIGMCEGDSGDLWKYEVTWDGDYIFENKPTTGEPIPAGPVAI